MRAGARISGHAASCAALAVTMVATLSGCVFGGAMDDDIEAELAMRIADEDETLDGVRVADVTDFEWDEMCAWGEGARNDEVKDPCGYDTGESHVTSTPGGGIAFCKDGKAAGRYGLMSRSLSRSAFLQKFGPDVVEAPADALLSCIEE